MWQNRAWTALVALALLFFSLPGSASAQQEFTVLDIEVEGNRVASRALILGVSSLEIGVPLTPTSTGETIRRLYGLGIFSDVRLEAEQITGGLRIVIVVEELPKLTGLTFSGNKKLESKELKSELGLGIGGYISPYLINQKQNQIAEMYAEDGYFQAAITPRVDLQRGFLRGLAPLHDR